MEKVSIIVPIYNSSNYIKTCIDSILNQTYNKFELILIDDGSTDNSLEIINSYNDSRIKVITQTNHGVSYTRNYGIDLASGKYIMFIDNDDYIDKDYIETYINSIQENDDDIVIGGYRRVNSKGKVLFSKTMKNKTHKFIQLAPWGKLYKRSFLKQNKLKFLEYGLGEDVYFNVNAYFCTDKIKMIEYIGYNWFYNENSISNSKQKGMTEENDPIYLLEKIKEKNQNHNIKDKELYDYFFLRYTIWYLLFSAKGTPKTFLLNRYEELFTFLDKNTNYKKTKYKSLFYKKSDELKTKIIINIILILRKIKLDKAFLNLYSKI